MRKTAPLFLLAILLSLVALDASAQRRRANKTPTQPPIPSVLPACVDFYQDIHKDWLAAHPSTYGMDTLSAVGELHQRVLNQQYELLNSMMTRPANAAQRALGTLWAKGLDKKAIEAEGLAAIEPLLEEINTIHRPRDIAPVLSKLHFSGVGAGFSFHAGPDPEGAGLLMGTFSEGPLGLPDPDYYLREDEDARLLLAHYTVYVQDILRLTGVPEEELQEQMRAVLNLETRLARLSRPLTPQNAPPDTDETEASAPPSEDDPDEVEAEAEVIPVRANAAELIKRYRYLQLQAFFTHHGIAEDAEVLIANPALLPGLNRLVAAIKPDLWKIYLRYHLARTLAPYLPRAFVDADFAFYGKILRGDSTPPLPPFEVLTAVNRLMGSVLAREYIAHHLDANTRHTAAGIASNLRDTLQRSVESNTWMSQPAKTEALAKLKSLKIEIAAPSGLDDDSGSLPDFSAGGFAQLMLESSRWHVEQDLRQIGQRDDSARRWSVLPQTPVLAYDLAHNRLIVSAAALQAPIFNPSAPRAAQYGSYGALVGRELSHAIDQHGQRINAAGQWQPWWTDDDTRIWNEKIAQLAAQYNAYPWPDVPDIRVDGARTAVENIADLSGIELALAALETEQPDRHTSALDPFFRAWAGLWREQTGPETAHYNALTQPYAPGRWRSNGPLMNHPAFSRTYQCPPESTMLRPTDKQISIWR